MGVIQPLPQDVIDRIAAGEVIERPAYAVKELLENALDAGATIIHLDLEEAGLRCITIADNGSGMEPVDIKMCFLPHTTSKLHTQTDLHSIATYGFRGEALASMAAISKMTIQSKNTHNEAGTQVEIQDGKMLTSHSIGMSTGTRVEVAELFHSMPARKKFLTNTRHEFQLILESVIDVALSHPDIHITLTHNGRKILMLPPRQTLLQRLESVYKLKETDVVPISYEAHFVNINGYISKPQASVPQKQHFFINNRPIVNADMLKVIREAYGSLLPMRKSPFVILTIQIPPEMVDANIHPRKEQVAFIHPDEIYTALQQAITQTLTTHNLIYTDLRWHKTNKKTQFDDQYLKSLLLPVKEKDQEKHVLGQLFDLYIVAQIDTELFLIDQHAAHERILYEQYKTIFQKQKELPQQHLLDKTVLLELSTLESETLNDSLDFFQSLGFDIEPFGTTTYKVTCIPHMFKGHDIPVLVKELLNDIQERNGIKEIDEKSNAVLTYIACRTAVKAGDSLTIDECMKLIEDLEKTPNNATCPHGRPTRIAFSLAHLNRQFKRS